MLFSLTSLTLQNSFVMESAKKAFDFDYDLFENYDNYKEKNPEIANFCYINYFSEYVKKSEYIQSKNDRKIINTIELQDMHKNSTPIFFTLILKQKNEFQDINILNLAYAIIGSISNMWNNNLGVNDRIYGDDPNNNLWFLSQEKIKIIKEDVQKKLDNGEMLNAIQKDYNDTYQRKNKTKETPQNQDYLDCAENYTITIE